MKSIPLPDRYSTPDNWFPTASGSIVRHEATFNGVVVQCFPSPDGESYSTAVSIMCKDDEMMPMLRNEARRIIEDTALRPAPKLPA